MQRRKLASLIRLSRVLLLSVLVVMLGGLLKPEAAVQPVSFGPKTDFGTGGSPHSVAVGDFDGDGKLDLAVANQVSNTVSILLGAGTGSFGPKTDFGTGGQSFSVAVGDFNGDGTLDLAVANVNSGTVSILLGTGTGSFGAKTDFDTGSISNPISVAVGDFNSDGKLDLAVANEHSATVSILLGTGTGSFGAKTDFDTGSNPRSVAVGDFNGDGKPDLAVANQGSPTVSILLGTGTGSFGAKTDFGTGSFSISVAVGDFNGDGKLDLGVANANSSTISILLGTGTGSFGAKTDFGTGTSPNSVAVRDFNGDGTLDLVVANAFSDSVSILLGTGTGSFETKADFAAGSNPRSVAVSDFNGDGTVDLATANDSSNTVSILLNTTPIVSSGVFCPKNDFGTSSGPQSVAVGDFNSDGHLDLAVANYSSNTVSILLGTGMGSFTAKTDFGTGSSPQSVALGDFNGDGKLDLAVANRNSNSVSILLGTGTGSFGPKTDFGTGNGPISVAVGDFNGDGKLDLAVANVNTAPSTVSILLGTGTGSFGTKTDFGTGYDPVSVVVGDFNGDGRLDLAVANNFSGTVSILLGTGTGSFGASTDFFAASWPSSVAVGDFNGDGNLDLAVTNNGNGSGSEVWILLGTGTGSFGARTAFGTGIYPSSVSVGDFNGDGKLDLGVANRNAATVSILLGTGTGSFGAKTDFGTGNGAISVAVGDFNGDGKLDLAVANQNSNTVSILLNTCILTPSIDAISPAVPVRSSTDQSVVVTGSGFQQNLAVTLTFPSGASTTLSGAQIQNVTSNSFTMLTTLNASGSWGLRVNNPDGAQSNTFSFNIGDGPSISSISPPSPVGSPTPQDVTIYGANIDANSTVTFIPPSGNAVTVKGKLVVQDRSKSGKLAPLFITPVILNIPGIWSLHVNNPNGGGQSNALSCTVRAPAPIIDDINPDPVTSGLQTTLTVSGSNFQSGFSASVTTPDGTFNIASGGLNFISSGEVRVQVTMCGTPPYAATIRISNPSGGSATKGFQVTGAAVACAPLYGTIGIQDGSLQVGQPPKWKLNGSGVLSLTVTAKSSTGGSPIPAQMNGSEYSFPSLPSGTYTLSVELRYKDNITVNNRAGLSENGCDKPAESILAKTSHLTINNVQAPSSSPKHIYFKPPLAMIHGINSCYQKWYGADSIQHWDRAARDLGFITFTPNYHFDGPSIYPWSVKIDEIRQQVESDLQGLTNEIASGDYHAYPSWVYIAHSMGGLVGRVLVNHSQTKDLPVIQALQKFYLLGTPNSGSHKFAIVDRFNFLSVKAITGIFPNPDFWNFNGKSVVAYAGTSEGFTDGWVPEDSVRNIYKGNCIYNGQTGKITCTDKQPVAPSLTTFTNSYEHTELGNPESRDELLIGLIKSDFCGLLPNNECGRSDCLNINPPCNPAIASPPKLAPATQPQVPLSNLRSIASQSQSLAATQPTIMTFTVGSTDLLTINAFISDGSASLLVFDPSNQVIDFDNLPATSGKHIVSELGEYFALRNPIPGVWSLRVTAGASGVVVSTVASENSPLGFEGFVTFPSIFTGQTGHLIAQWAGITTGITGPSVNAQVINEAGSVITTISLFDDGNHGDNAASDGVFGGDTPTLSTAGRYLIIFTAQGDVNGLAFARWADALLDVVAPTHTLTGSFSDVAIDSDSNGTYDNIRETVGISVTSAGGYHVSADLYDAQGYFINHAIGYAQANAGGVYSVNLDFNMANVTCGQFASPFTIKNLTLSDAGSLQVLDIYNQNPTSQPYDGSLFGCVSGTPAPTIISVQPNSMFPSTSGQVIISGNSFLNGAQVSSVAGVSVSSVIFGSSSVLVAQVNVDAGATPGSRDVTITNPDGHSSTATALFTVASDQAPSVSINNLANQQIINGTISVSATATDDIGIQRVEFYIDGVLSGTDTTFPYQYVWDTSTAPNGPHTFAAKAFDTTNQNATAQVIVVVSCTMGFAPDHQSFPAAGGNGTINVTSACNWSATSNTPWIIITSGAGAGNGAITYSVDQNTASSIRNGTITVAGQTFSIYQGINFLDVPEGALFYNEIGKLSARGVTLGCGNGNFCPNDVVTRDQMAAFIMRAKGEFNPPTPASQRFNDVPPSNVFYNFIDRLAELQITLGCSPTMYCPADQVKREQMAAFLIRGLGEFNPPPPPMQRFTDVPPENPFYKFIDRMAVLQITLGCSPTMYCPSDTVTRAQMAAFLVRAFNL